MSRRGHVVAGPLGRIELTAGALAGVVLAAAESVDGARVRRPRRGLEVHVDDDRAHVELELAAPFGAVLPELARNVQASVAAALAATAGLAATVDVDVEELHG
jgi:uncharacterized alkaline shock family protein YloU